MSRAELKHREDYVRDFDPDAYLNTTSGELTAGLGDSLTLREFFFSGYNEIFKNGKVTGRKLMNIGTGPIPLSVVSAVPYVHEIYFSDYTPANRDYLYKWVTGSSKQDYKYTSMFEFYSKTEAKGESWQQRAEDLKAKVGGIFPIDLVREKTFGDVLFPQFDILTSSLCFEFVAKEVKEFEVYAKNIAEFLKPGGHFMINGVLGCSFYNIGSEKFHVSPITKEELKTCFTNAGYTIQSFSECEGPPKKENNVSDYEFGFVMHCTKN